MAGILTGGTRRGPRLLAGMGFLLGWVALGPAAMADGRVVWCKPKCAGGQRLLQANGAEIGVVSDAQLIQRGWPVLYWTVDAYRVAVEGLSPSDRQEAVIQRKARYPDEALSNALAELAEDARACAIRQARVGASLSLPLEEYGRTTSVASTTPVAEVVLRRQLVEQEARIVALVRFAANLARSAGWPEATEWTEDASALLAAAQEDSAALAELGWPTYAKALPHPEPQVVVYVPHPSDEWITTLTKMRETFARWRGGIFAYHSLSRLSAEPDSVLSYLDTGEFLGDLAGTPAQRERAFTQRLRTGSQPGAWLDHLSRQLLELRSLLAATIDSTKRGTAVVDRLRVRLQSLDARLLRMLAALPPPPPDVCSRWAKDASLFVTLARRAGDRETAQLLERVSRKR